MDARQKIASEVLEQRDLSRKWMEANFYSEWEQAYKNYKALPDEKQNKDDPDEETVGMPDTWAYARRNVARVTARIPNFKYRSRDKQIGELISRTIMYQWDAAKMQRIQKKHVLQATIFGWSPRPWYWSVDEHLSSKRVNLMDPDLDRSVIEQVGQTYPDWFASKGYRPEMLMGGDIELAMLIREELMAEFSRGGLLPVKYLYKSYEGPRADFLFAGDAYPEPDFQDVQSGNWFIVDRRRNLSFFKRLIKAYPETAAGVQELLDKFPNGTNRYKDTNDGEELRRRMESVLSRTRDVDGARDRSMQWTISERHIPGDNPKLAWVGEGNILLGEIEYPYDLQGKIAFTECVLIDDLLCGIGDSIPRIMRGLHRLHGKHVSTRANLIYNILRPLIGTTNRELIENPGLVKRHGGFRMVHMRGPGEMWVQSEQAAIAAAAVGMNDETSHLRLYQMLTGENNLSQAANVDPAQNRTATGAKILQGNQDVLTKDVNDMFAASSLSADGEMMRLLNRSELAEPVEFDSSPYRRPYAMQEDAWKREWIKVEPVHFQTDLEIVAEAGSTLADDDESRVAVATNLFQAATSFPQLINPEKAAEDFLVAHGKGSELEQWKPAPPEPPPPEVRTSMSVAVPWLALSPVAQAELFKKARIDTGELEGQDLSDIPPETIANLAKPAPKPPMGGTGEKPASRPV